ncbi:glutathione S-transferase family protein [Aspergillus lucknowensis]|uniref:GST N-terminal domain-containing protein n=1 Tax=Aspergillus lucknowensis TaxID=176173 RepID=A0ABR4LI58_9EURO
MADTSPQFTLYSDVASQWAYTAHLTLDETGYKPDEYIVKQVGLLDAENFAPQYVKINPNGTIPSLTSRSLPHPLIESADVVKYLDSHRPNSSPSLFPADPTIRTKVDDLIAHVHQMTLSTTLILLHARDAEELETKKASPFRAYINKRQEKLIEYGSAHPEIPLYALRTPDNGHLSHLYNAQNLGPEHESFFEASHRGYRDFAAGLDMLDSMLVLPFAAGDQVTAADMHVVPWLAHALWGAGGSAVNDFGPLRELLRKSVPGFEIGDRIKAWWANISASESFRKNYPTLH